VRKYVLQKRGIFRRHSASPARPLPPPRKLGRLSAVPCRQGDRAPTCSRKPARRSSQFLMVRSAPSRASRTMRAHLSHPSRRGPGAAPQDEVDTGVRPDVHRTARRVTRHHPAALATARNQAAARSSLHDGAPLWDRLQFRRSCSRRQCRQERSMS
jgi:hypothetical protein